MKNWCRYYLGNFWKYLGNFFNPASGHTAHERQVGTYLGRNFDKRQRNKKKDDLEWKNKWYLGRERLQTIRSRENEEKMN